MGSWFSNFHIRKGETTTQDTVAETITKLLDEKGYYPVSTEGDAEGTVAILSNECSGWFSVCSEILGFEDPKHFADMAVPLSKQLQTDILGISCFDSDYLYLNLINAGSKTDAWVGIGSAAAYDIRRRTNLTAWQGHVEKFPYFSECVKKQYVFAEEFLGKAENCLSLPAAYGALDFNDLQELEADGEVTYLYFKVDASSTIKNESVLPEFGWELSSDRPCFPEKKVTLSVRNRGAASKGLSIYFLGPYVKKEELTFSDTVLWRWNGDEVEYSPFELQKIRMPDGKWAYQYHDPDYPILPRLDAIDRLLPLKKQLQMDRDQGVYLSFISHGNQRKILDVTVEIVPDENPEGKVSWNVWKKWGSKKAYFQMMHTLTLAKFPGFEPFLYRRIEFD